MSFLCTYKRSYVLIYFKIEHTKIYNSSWHLYFYRLFFFSLLQRQVADYDKIDKDEKITSSAQIFRDGHTGILTTELDARVDNVTTVRHSYKKPEPCGVRLVGNGIKNYRPVVADVLISCTENIFENLLQLQPSNVYKYCTLHVCRSDRFNRQDQIVQLVEHLGFKGLRFKSWSGLSLFPSFCYT